MKVEALLLIALPAFGQGVVGMSANFGSGPDGVLRGSATFRVGPTMAPILNAPYSGEEVQESLQILADGTRITRPNAGPQQKYWRDSQGRVRTERPLGMRPDSPVITQISDPVSGYVYVLDSVNQVAHRVHVGTSTGPGSGSSSRMTSMPAGIAASSGLPTATGGGFGVGSGGGMAPASGQAPQSTVEQLGTKMIDGVLVSGRRTSTVIPVGAQGNDRPMTATTEVWVSDQLKLPILSVNYSPLNGTTTRKYVNFSTAEPVASLFLPPPNYSIVDEKESFTIRWGEQ